MPGSSSLIDSLRKLTVATIPPGGSLKYGYVYNIHMGDDADPLYGTVDVQEYTIDTNGDPNSGEGQYEGVRLSAIQDLSIGVSMIPKLYSDVVFIVNNEDNTAYVTMVSQVDTIRFESGSSIAIGTVDRGVYDPEKDIDIDDMPSTGNEAMTEYGLLYVESTVRDKDGRRGKTSITGYSIESEIKDQNGNKSSVIIKPDSIKASVGDDNKVSMDKNGVSVKFKGTEFKIEDGKVIVNAAEVEITGGSLTTKGIANTDMQGPYCAIPTCPFSGAPHTGSKVTGT